MLVHFDFSVSNLFLIAAKAEPISEIWQENSENGCLCLQTAGSDSPLHSRD